jgi:Fe2+ or Zn2+ uptake regulation protein
MKQRRNTKQREMILDTVHKRKDHPSADDVYLDIRSENPSVSRGTVYRNLNILTDEGAVNHVKIPGADRFDYRLEPHYHLLCTECGKVIDVEIPYRAELDHALKEQTGYEIKQHSTLFEGICPDCRAKKERDTK